MIGTTYGVSLWSLLLLGCASHEMAYGDAVDEAYAEDGAMALDSGWMGEASDDNYAPEEEQSLVALKPAATSSYLFVANRDRGTVTRITVPGLAVVTTEVGDMPTTVLTTPDDATAVCFNQGSNDISIIDADSLEVATVEVRENLNTVEMAPDGAWVALFHDRAAVAEDDPDPDGTVSTNEVSFVKLESGTHFPMVVGENPRDIQFSESGGIAVVLSDTVITVVDLRVTEPTPVRILLTDDLVSPNPAEEMVIDLDGTWAFVRQFQAMDLLVVDLDSGEVSEVPVGMNPTDMDVSPDGNQVAVVARGDGEVWVYDLENPFGEPDVLPLPDEIIAGSLLFSPDDSLALLYSTASGESLVATWDRTAPLVSAAVTVRGLVKPISSMDVSPTGGTLMVFHNADQNGELESDSPFFNKYGLTLVDLETFFTNPLALAAEPLEFSHTDDGTLGFFVMDGIASLEQINYGSLLPDEVALPSAPEHLGVLPGRKTAFVSQEHDLGRISFYNPDAEDLETITGFELNAGIEDSSR